MQARSTHVSASKANSVNFQPSAYEILKQKLAGYNVADTQPTQTRNKGLNKPRSGNYMFENHNSSS